jgi:hypothetical protein
LLATSSTCSLKPRFLSQRVVWLVLVDRADISRHVIDMQIDPSFIELHVIMRYGLNPYTP